MTFKPMLAGKVDDAKLAFPLLASPKLDGVRATNIEGTLRSRSLKPFANRYTQQRFSTKKLHGLDGEFILDSPTATDVYRMTNQALATIEGAPQLTLWVFDDWTSSAGYATRMAQARERVAELHREVIDVRFLPHEIIMDAQALDYYEGEWVAEGYEGVMLRSIPGPYKFGRSTTNEGYLLKLKRYEDGEAVVESVEEEQRNDNEATKDALGRTKRSSHQSGKVGKGTMGALNCRGLSAPFEGVDFRVGSGFTAADRQRTDWVGKVIKYKYFAVGVKDKPRHPVYLGERMKEDM